MDAQPDMGKISEAFMTTSTALATASHEIALVTNVPAFNDGQRLLEAIERLTTSVDNLRTDMNSKFDSLELRMRAESVYFPPFPSFIVMTFYSSLNHRAITYNSHISSRDTPLRVLHNQRNMVVEGFPRDAANLMRLSG